MKRGERLLEMARRAGPLPTSLLAVSGSEGARLADAFAKDSAGIVVPLPCGHGSFEGAEGWYLAPDTYTACECGAEFYIVARNGGYAAEPKLPVLP